MEEPKGLDIPSDFKVGFELFKSHLIELGLTEEEAKKLIQDWNEE